MKKLMMMLMIIIVKPCQQAQQQHNHHFFKKTFTKGDIKMLRLKSFNTVLNFAFRFYEVSFLINYKQEKIRSQFFSIAFKEFMLISV